jgi:hypothetical protein
MVFTWIALTASGLTLYRLARAFANSNAALLAAVLYLANPYMLFTAYERTAYAELLAAAWIPLLFYAILRERVKVTAVALPVALLWLTNAPAAVLGTYALAFLAAIRLLSILRRESASPAAEKWLSRHATSLQFAAKTFAGTVLGFGLAAFYIVPVAYQRRFVQVSMSAIGGMGIDQNFLFEHTGSSADAILHDQVLHTVSVIALILLAAAVLALGPSLIMRKQTPAAPRLPTRTLSILVAGIAFLLTPLSLAIWKHAPEAVFLQFPWRLLSLVAAIAALAAAVALSRAGLRFTLATAVALAMAAALTAPAYRQFSQACDPEDTARARLALFQSNLGSDPTDEYTPIQADNDSLKPNDPPYWLAASPESPAPAPPTAQPGLAPMHFAVTAPRAEDLVLNLRDYPAWQVTLNGSPDSTRLERDDGLIAIPIPAGRSTIDIRYAPTNDAVLGDSVSVLALALFALGLRREPTAPSFP